MTSVAPTRLQDACDTYLLQIKWLLSPSHRVGHQWVEKLVRSGHHVVNLHPTTVIRLALGIVGSDLANDGLTLASRSVGALVVDSTWHQVNPGGYLGRLDQTAELSMSVFDSLLALRLAGCTSAQIDETHLESRAKAQDIEHLLNAYEAFLDRNKFLDEAEVLRRAIAKLGTAPIVLGDDAIVLIPAGMHVAGLERQFLAALAAGAWLEVRHPAEHPESREAATDIGLLATVGNAARGPEPKNDGSVQFIRSVGEINEVREVLRRALADKQPLDEVEILHTDADTYVPLIFGTGRRHFSEPDRPDGVPVTFAEGIPTSLSRPGRALVAWLHWIREGYPQRLLVEMIGEGLLDCGEDDDLSLGYLTRLLRPVGIGLGADQYLPKLDEQIKALGTAPPSLSSDGDDNTSASKSHERKLKGFKVLRKLIQRLLSLSDEVFSANGASALQAAERFLSTVARSISELDRYSADALVEQIEDRRLWLDRLGLTMDLVKWLGALPAQTRVLGSGPRPGHLHVAHVNSGGHSGRKRTFVIGLDDRRFPGAALQDPVLLDRERARLSPELPTSAARLRHKIDELATTLSRLAGSVTLSWSCLDLAEDRETFPSSAVLAAYRLISGSHDADLDALNDATAPPVSFAPTAPEKSLDESERWLWRLSDDGIQGTNQMPLVEAFFPHLARGRAALGQRATGFGSFNGYVPEAGKNLNPFAAGGPVLSASALETAGRCPLAFFFRNGLKLYPPEELEIDPDRWINAAQFGSLLHEVFRRFMEELSAAGQQPEYERDHERLATILREAVTRWRREVPPPNENAFRMQYWQLMRTAHIFLQTEEEFCKTSVPRFFEVALGLDPVAGGTPLDDKEPASVSLPGGRMIRTKGQIDRVDETGAGRYAVWDYKTGSGYGYDRGDPFRRGRRVQSVLYLRMIETTLRSKLQPQAIVERFGYFFPGIRAHGLRIDWDANTLSAGLETLERLCAAVEAGAFLATDDAEDCRYCDYASICNNVNQVTSHSKTLLGRDDLVPLTPFRELRRG
jgi:RecB family exonuclease